MLVCSALAIGNVVAKVHIRLLGLIGLLAAPAAFAVAKAEQRSLSQGISAAGSVPTEMAIVKGVEYAMFGALIAWTSKKESGKPISPSVPGWASQLRAMSSSAVNNAIHRLPRVPSSPAA